MDNTSTKVDRLDSLKDVKAFFNKHAIRAINSIVKTLKSYLAGKYFIVKYRNLGPDWDYFGKIINVKPRRDKLTGVFLEYEDDGVRDEYELSLLHLPNDFTSSENIRFFDDESSAKLFIETTKLI